MNIYEKLMNIQVDLKAPKNQFNSFGKYNYRSCEDILEGLKPLLNKHKATLTIDDEIVQIGDRYYVRATARLHDTGDGPVITTTAYAREDETKKRMDLAQVTGSTSSYARKYALNGLFAIDDTKDSDSTNTHGKEDKGQSTKEQSKSQQNRKSTTNSNTKFSTLKCIDCDEDITQAVKTFSEKKFGRALCMNCQKKEK
ncbi:ERF family protein [Paratissierella segnis]|uniref:ERF family protein n=1 Tax=Paratissierella segnis TaxID=2763679 RepID=A0A926IKV4_9FIRM|nr:ERF family protein [Paratissierella segnis]MBC8588058.1 ERF family protein [Paratissierella segnis]